MRFEMSGLVLLTLIGSWLAPEASAQADGACDALDFDGVDDRVMVPYSASFPTEVFTVAAWIKAEIPRRRASIVARGEDNVSGNDPWKIILQTDGTFILMLEDANDVNATYSSGTFVADDDWHHVAATRQQSGAVATYVDAAPRASFSSSIVPSSANSQFLTIGCTHGIFGPPPPPPIPAWFFPGQIDEPAVWNRALTAQEIFRVYEQGVAPDSPGLIGHWNFNEGSGQAVLDSSPHANHGFLGANNNINGDSADPERIIVCVCQPCDANCDGLFNGGDIDAFFLALGDPAAWAAQYPGCEILCVADVNGDGSVNGGDIDPFFAALGQGSCP